jgi:ATP-dependent DNA ligase
LPTPIKGKGTPRRQFSGDQIGSPAQYDTRNGYRAIALRGDTETRILSRNEKDLGSKFREVQNSIGALDVQDVMIDGEIVALNDKGRPSFQLLLQGFDRDWCAR